MNSILLVLSKNRRGNDRKKESSVSIVLTKSNLFVRFYDFMSNVIGGGNSFAPNETKW